MSFALPIRLRAVIADDHPRYRTALARVLRHSGVDVVAEVANGEAAIRAVTDKAPEVVVMDLSMPGMSGLEATRRLRTEMPSTRVLVLSVSALADDVRGAMRAGAQGYLLKDGPLEDVVVGVRAAASGHSLISPGVLGAGQVGAIPRSP